MIFEYILCIIHLTRPFKSHKDEQGNWENYSFGPQTQAKCQDSSMVKQGQ